MLKSRLMTAMFIAMLATAAACSGGGGDSDGGDPDSDSTPAQQDNGFTRAAMEFIAAVRDRDAVRYASLWVSDQEPPRDHIEDAFDSADLAACDAASAEFRMAEGNGGVYVDVIFDEPCGSSA
jgi:hypothetical protein